MKILELFLSGGFFKLIFIIVCLLICSWVSLFEVFYVLLSFQEYWVSEIWTIAPSWEM